MTKSEIYERGVQNRGKIINLSKTNTTQEIAVLLGLSCTYINKTLRNIPHYKKPCETHEKILELRKQGMRQVDIAHIIGISRTTVCQVCNENGVGGKTKPKDDKNIDDKKINKLKSVGYRYISGCVGRKSKIKVSCLHCGREVDGTYNDIVCHWGKCSACKDLERQKEKAKRNEAEEAKRRTRQQNRERKEREKQDKIEAISKLNMVLHTCNNCGKMFCITDTNYNSNIYCSKVCASRYYNRIKNDKRLKEIASRRHDTDITLERLFKRDRGVCYICGCSCDWADIEKKNSTLISGNSYPSIEHIKPLSKGGTHTWDNIKLACRKCNTLKGSNEW